MSTEDFLSDKTGLTIQELPDVLHGILAQTFLLRLPEGSWGLFVRYLRRKSGRGLAVIYDACQILPRSLRKSAIHQAVSLTIDEQMLTQAFIHITHEQARAALLGQKATSTSQSEKSGLSLQTFPADSGLPHLAACCDISTSSPLLAHLQHVAQQLLMDTTWKPLEARAVPIRYKPSNRCVIRYDLTIVQAQTSNQPRKLSIFGKVYANPEQARTVHALTQQLYTEQLALPDLVGDTSLGQRPFLPRPLLFVESLGLTLNEAVQPVPPAGFLRAGIKVLQPQFIQERSGRMVSPELPAHELRLAATALARLHTSAVDPGQHTLRTGAKEAKRVHERAALLANYYPVHAGVIQNLAMTLAQHLENLYPETYRPAHGGFKASQLLYYDGTVSVVDFDGFCLADPALDVGYFLAYLRPSSLWYRRQGTRSWFEAAAEIFTTTYASALLKSDLSPKRNLFIEDGGAHPCGKVSSEETVGILQRAQLYAAALLFKIATRRVNRLNSPRAQELASMLQEISTCLVLGTGGK